MKSVMEALNWRYSTKAFDADKKIPQGDLNQLLEATNLAATSLGLQPYKMVVIESEEMKNKIIAETKINQSQISTASHIVVFSRRLDVDENYINGYLKLVEQVRKIDQETLKPYKEFMVGHVVSMDESVKPHWISKQIYLAMGTMLTVAAQMKIDICPIGGFDRQDYDRILGLEEKGLASDIVCALGYRNSEDKYQFMPKVRRPLDEMVIKM